jgi:hypothetical protein
LYSQEHYVSISDVARTHVDAALNPTISNGHRYLLIADRASWQQVGRAAVTAQPELKSHLPPLPESPSEEEKTFSRFSYEADRVEKNFGWKCTLASPPSLPSSSTDPFSLRTDHTKSTSASLRGTSSSLLRREDSCEKSLLAKSVAMKGVLENEVA